jgi:DNA-binding response OmpR family regulator
MNLRNEKILLVDDDPHVINRMVDILSEHNTDYIFYQANNGDVGSKIAHNKLPDIIITDWDMPQLNGIEFIKRLKESEKTKDIPVIMATAVMISSEDLKTALRAGAVDYIRKPIDPVELTARVNSAIKISEYHNRMIENKNNEIAEATLFLIRNNKFNIQLIKKLQDLYDALENVNTDQENLFEFIISSIEEKVKEDSWQRFEIAFKSTNVDFEKNLLNDFPELSKTEMKLCTFLKLGMNTKRHSIGSIYQPRQRESIQIEITKKTEFGFISKLNYFFLKILISSVRYKKFLLSKAENS